MSLKKILLSLIVGFALGKSMWASPAFPRKMVVSQPSGALLELYHAGDESLHYWRTTDGLPVVQDRGKRWCYALLEADGLVSTDYEAHNELERPSEEQRQAEKIRQEWLQVRQAPCSLQKYGLGTQQVASINAMGAYHVPIILVQFADVRFTEQCSLAFYQSHFNAEKYKDEGGFGSVRDYFISQSDSLFQPEFDIIGLVTLPNALAYYGGNSGGSDIRSAVMAAQAIDSMVARGFDFSPYSTNGTRVPFVGIVFAGYGEQVNPEHSEAIWAKYLYTFSHTNKGYTFSTALMVNELADYEGGNPQPDGIGTFCHEFSHAMGLPDFYATNGISVFGLDYWDLMDWGQYQNNGRRPVGYSAYERMFMGWLQPITLGQEKQYVELSPLAGQAGVRSVLIPNTHDASQHEYLLLENRTSSPWFSPSYGEGMLVYHVDYNATNWVKNQVNCDASRQGITILPADGKLTPSAYVSDGKMCYATASDYQGDLFPGYSQNRELSALSVPPAVAHVGDFFTQKLTQITRRADGSVTFCYQADGILNQPASLAVSDVTDHAAQVSWMSVDHAEAYCVVVRLQETVLSRDTVTETAFLLSDLQPEQNYSVEVFALAADYIDSPLAQVGFTTVPLSAQALRVKNTSSAWAIYDLQGHPVGEVRHPDALDGLPLPQGIYILRQNHKAIKIIIQ